MFDTNIFDRIVKKDVDISSLKDTEIYATHIQYDELNKTEDNDHRTKLIKLFHKATQTDPTDGRLSGAPSESSEKVVSTESAVWDVSKWDKAKWGGNFLSTESSVFGVGRYGVGKYGGGNLLKKIWENLDKKNKKKKNNSKDALIAETAIINGLILVTHDSDLYSVVTNEFQASATNLYALLEATKYLKD